MNPENVARVGRMLGRLPRESAAWGGPPERLVARRDRRLRYLLWSARARSGWWRDRLARVDTDRATAADLQSVPVLRREELAECWAGIACSPDLAALASPADAAGCTSAGGFEIVRSSGTTGSPVVVAWSATGWRAMALVAMRESSRSVAPQPSGTPKVMGVFGADSRAISAAIARTWSSPFLEIVPVAASLDAGALVGRLLEEQPSELRGFPSALRRMAVEILARGLRLPPLRVGASGELLTPATAELLRRAFGAAPTDAWGATEAGWIGFSGGVGPMRVAEDACLVESVDADEQPVPDGEAGEAVLLTPLTNGEFPLVRYRVDDSVRLWREGGRQLVEICGRSPGTVELSGAAVPARALLAAIESALAPADRSDAVADYRLSAAGDRLTVSLGARLGPSKEAELARRCEVALRAAGISGTVGVLGGAVLELTPGGKAMRLASGEPAGVPAAGAAR